MRPWLTYVGLSRWKALLWGDRPLTFTIGLAVGFAASCFLFGAWGCSLPVDRTSTLQQEQRENVGQKALGEFVQSTTPTPMVVEIPQKGTDPIKVQVPPHAKTTAIGRVEEDSISRAFGKYVWSESVPVLIAIGAGLVLIALGLGMLGVIFWLLKRSSAVNAAWSVGDEFLVKGINRIKSEAMSSTDPALSAKMSALAAEMESDRTTFNKE